MACSHPRQRRPRNTKRFPHPHCQQQSLAGAQSSSGHQKKQLDPLQDVQLGAGEGPLGAEPPWWHRDLAQSRWQSHRVGFGCSVWAMKCSGQCSCTHVSPGAAQLIILPHHRAHGCSTSTQRMFPLSTLSLTASKGSRNGLTTAVLLFGERGCRKREKREVISHALSRISLQNCDFLRIFSLKKNP